MPESFPILISVAAEDAGKRLDQFLATRLDSVSRARVQEMIAEGKALVNDFPAKASLKLRGGERISVLGEAQRAPLKAIAEKIPLDIVYEDEDLAVINKPAGMMVHAGARATDDARYRGTLIGVSYLATFAASVTSGRIGGLYETLSPKQREDICFAWDYQDPKRGLLRTRVANNWEITKQMIKSDFYTNDQRAIIRGIFEGIISPEWHERIDKQLGDDSGGYGTHNSIAIFGTPGSDKSEFVMTGRHMTIRCDGNSADHVPCDRRSSERIR